MIDDDYVDALVRETSSTKTVPVTATLRDQFAMAALQGALASDTEGNWSDDQLTEYTYRIADAMLEARKEK